MADRHEPPRTLAIRWCSECGQHAPAMPSDLLDRPGPVARLGRLHSRSFGPAFAACPGTVQTLTYTLAPKDGLSPSAVIAAVEALAVLSEHDGEAWLDRAEVLACLAAS